MGLTFCVTGEHVWVGKRYVENAFLRLPHGLWPTVWCARGRYRALRAPCGALWHEVRVDERTAVTLQTGDAVIRVTIFFTTPRKNPKKCPSASTSCSALPTSRRKGSEAWPSG
eukprot:3705416-Prymnesium_polylepis.1